ncbi:hypothetical protein QAD02_020997 [Eretmocerus hayati]|uniref:Uncharacterized protein n=1 Tax=Eretmocerus hayati TaxID=131215 RepID=A0ACC2PRI3_9HYME|nr:hypothetical protein QAD02_020997 [Eretmocerus hayati]
MDLESKLTRSTLKFYNNLGVSRNVIQDVIKWLIDIASKIVPSYILQQVETTMPNCDSNFLDVLRSSFKKSTAIFDKFSTEHRRFKLYRNKSLMIESESIEIGKKIVTRLKDDQTIQLKEKVFAEYISLGSSLKILFETPGIFCTVKDYMASLDNEKNIISNYSQCEQFQEIKEAFGPGKILIPLFGFNDEFVYGSPVGLHSASTKLDGVDMTTLLPPNLSSKLDLILLVMVDKASDLKKYSNNRALYRRLIIELNELNETGLDVLVDGKPYKLHFVLCLWEGDNKGLNAMLGYTENFYWGLARRICYADSDMIKALVREVESLLRTKESYIIDYKKKRSIFHRFDRLLRIQ